MPGYHTSRDFESELRELRAHLLAMGARCERSVQLALKAFIEGSAELIHEEEVIEVLNQYLSEMTDAIMDNGGTLVSYIGDGIMAIFGAPLEQTDHADRAVSRHHALPLQLPPHADVLHVVVAGMFLP